jgi:hypothetical protein
MTKPMIRIHDTQTNEIVDREMTDEEFDEYTEKNTQQKARLQATEKKDEARQSALSKLIDLGLTEEEIAAL